jgi:hypothetical protein
VDPRAGLDSEARRKILCICLGLNPSRPVHSQALYCLSYPGSYFHHTPHVRACVSNMTVYVWHDVFVQKNYASYVRFEILTMVKISVLFWVVMLCRYQHFRET